MLATLVAVLMFALPAALTYVLFRRVRTLTLVSGQLTCSMFVAGALAAGITTYVERLVLAWTGLSFDVRASGAGSALLATFLLAAPLEEAAKVAGVWPLYRMRRIAGPRAGILYAAAIGAGFAASEAALVALLQGVTPMLVLRALVGIPAHVFFAGLWGYTLGGGRRERERFFPLAWLCATSLHGLYDHIVWGRGTGLLVGVIPLMVFMATGAWIALREAAPESAMAHHSVLEPPSLESMRAALRPADRPLLVRWIVVGAFVTLGLMIASVAAAVLLGNRAGIDFSLADESDLRASEPLALLGAAVLLAFPFAGFLVARASSAHSMLEPALAAGLAIALLVAALAITAPLGVLFALAVAPLAFGLACAGAWLGLERD